MRTATYEDFFGAYEARGKEKRCVYDRHTMKVTIPRCGLCPLAKLLNDTEAILKKYKHRNGFFFKPDRLHLAHAERMRIKDHLRRHSEYVVEGNFIVRKKQSKGIWVPMEHCMV